LKERGLEEEKKRHSGIGSNWPWGRKREEGQEGYGGWEGKREIGGRRGPRGSRYLSSGQPSLGDGQLFGKLLITAPTLGLVLQEKKGNLHGQKRLGKNPIWTRGRTATAHETEMKKRGGKKSSMEPCIWCGTKGKLRGGQRSGKKKTSSAKDASRKVHLKGKRRGEREENNNKREREGKRKKKEKGKPKLIFFVGNTSEKGRLKRGKGERN